MKNPYEILGISADATDEQVKEAYRNLAKKYHPDNYVNNPLADIAEEKMAEINSAYDEILEMRKKGQNNGSYAGVNYDGYGSYSSSSSSAASSRYPEIREMIRRGQIEEAERMLDNVSSMSRDAEWYFLKGVVQYRRGWMESAYQNIATACRLDPYNQEYRSTLSHIENAQTGGYRTQGGNSYSSCSCCDVCAAMACFDCLCDCC